MVHEKHRSIHFAAVVYVCILNANVSKNLGVIVRVAAIAINGLEVSLSCPRQKGEKAGLVSKNVSQGVKACISSTSEDVTVSCWELRTDSVKYRIVDSNKFFRRMSPTTRTGGA